MSAEVKLSMNAQSHAELVALLAYVSGRVTKEQFIVTMITLGYKPEHFMPDKFDLQLKYIADNLKAVVI